MAERNYWLDSTFLGKAAQAQNFGDKLPGYATQLELTEPQVSAMVANATAIVLAINAAEASKLTQQGMIQWRDSVLTGDPQGAPAEPAPVFAVVSANLLKRGSLRTFIANRDFILTQPGYTASIGEDLGLIGSSSTKKPADETAPLMKSVSVNGYSVTLSGSMQGFDGMRVEYAKKGGGYTTVAFLTNLPGTFQITPAVPDQPEVGQIRTVFIKKNVDYGNYSPDYTVTLS